ncbi:hypothetical protein NPIL_261451 [Nephila pilipes]|uniref:Uncharacterized protein n=1 Tax=Nephila pilipes TaxID=299642 RepID=A0A8X6QVY9_NEPPI|nr:hypothetical protein NPIL_261451 [Nephila pilipes]
MVIRSWFSNKLLENNIFQLTWNGEKPPFFNIHWSSISVYELFLNDEIIEYILEQSILYAGQKGDHDFVIGAENLKLFLLSYLLMDTMFSQEDECTRKIRVK